MKFRVITLLLVVAFIAAWLATLTVETNLGIALREPLWALVLALPVIAILHSRGRQRAFLSGVVVILVLRAVPNNWLTIRVKFGFARQLGQYFATYAPADKQSAMEFGLTDTISLFCTLGLCLICGLFAVAVYDSSRKQRDADSD